MTDAMAPSVLKADSEDLSRLAVAAGDKALTVVGLCAAWCNTCAEFSDAFASIADERRDATFVWLDIEDDADLAGDIDVENFPTVAVFSEGRLVHFGVSLPQRGVLARLLGSLNAESRTVPADAAITRLPAALAALAQQRSLA